MIIEFMLIRKQGGLCSHISAMLILTKLMSLSRLSGRGSRASLKVVCNVNIIPDVGDITGGLELALPPDDARGDIFWHESKTICLI